MAGQTALEWLPPYSWCPAHFGRPRYDCPMPLGGGLVVNLASHPALGHIVGSACRVLSPLLSLAFAALLIANHKMLALPPGPDMPQRWEYTQRAAQIAQLLPNYPLAAQFAGRQPPRFVRFPILAAVQRYVDRKFPPPEGQDIETQRDPSRGGAARLRAVVLGLHP